MCFVCGSEHKFASVKLIFEKLTLFMSDAMSSFNAAHVVNFFPVIKAPQWVE
jgi:hypothetical protein